MLRICGHRVLSSNRYRQVRETITTRHTLAKRHTRFMKKRMFSEVLEVYATMASLNKIPPKPIYDDFLYACSQLKLSDLAFRIFMEMDENNIVADAKTFTNLMTVCTKADLARIALKSYINMREGHVDMNEYVISAVIKAYGSLGEYKEALRILGEMRWQGIRPNKVVYGAAVDSCQKAGNWEWALKLVDVMEEEGIEANVKIYTSVILALGEAGEMEKLDKVLGDMRLKGIEMNSYSWNAYLSGLGRLGQWDVILEKFNGIPSADGVYICGTALRACNALGKSELALDILGRLGSSCEPWLYNLALSACCRAKDASRVQEVVKLMESNGVNLDCIGLDQIIRLGNGIGEWEWSKWQQLKESRDLKGLPGTIVRNGSWKHALLILEDVESDPHLRNDAIRILKRQQKPHLVPLFNSNLS